MITLADPTISLPPALPIPVLFALVALVLDVMVALYFIDDLMKPERRVAGGDKAIWLVIILFGSILGWLAYLYIGRGN